MLFDADLFKHFLNPCACLTIEFDANSADTLPMRISTGIAEIGFTVPGSQRITSEQFYVWPLYNAGRVENIHGVTRRTDSNITYTKPSPEDRDRIMNLSRDRSLKEYSITGKLRNPANGIQPGSLFEAIV